MGIARTRGEMKGDRVGTAARGEANKEDERCRGIREVRANVDPNTCVPMGQKEQK